jgi:hypothetical protein
VRRDFLERVIDALVRHFAQQHAHRLRVPPCEVFEPNGKTALAIGGEPSALPCGNLFAGIFAAFEHRCGQV